MATIRDVAKMAGVSISTVSVALRDKSQVTPETFQRIANAADAVGYRPDPLAQSLKTGRSKLIGVIVGTLSNPYFGELMDGIELTALKSGHLVILSDSRTDPARERQIIDALRGQKVGGIIISPHFSSPEHVEYLSKVQTPLVLLDHKIPGVAADFVGIDNALAMAMLTEHVIRFGHTRIAHIAGLAGLWTAEQRKDGFRATLRAAGIEPDESMIVDGRYTGDQAYEEAMRLLTRADRPTAIVAANNLMGLAALQAMNDLGFRCPEDVSLVTFDNVPWGNVIQPPLTYVVQPIAEIARVATEFLLERIEEVGKRHLPPRERIFSPKLVLGRSCAPPPH